MGIGTGDHDFAGFNGLTQGFQHGAGKFGKFVHEQNAVVGQATSPGLAPLPPPTMAAIEAV